MNGHSTRTRKWIGVLTLVLALVAFAGCAAWFGDDDDGPIGSGGDPSFVGGITSSVAKGMPGEMATFTVNATDPEGDALTYAWDDGDSVNGTFSEKGASEFNTNNKQVNWMTTVEGDYFITCTVRDGDGNTDTTSFLFSVGDGGGGVPAGPVITGLTVNNANPEPGDDVDLVVTATHPDGATLTYSWGDNGGGGSFSGSGASVSYSNNTEGTYNLTVTVSDGTNDASFSTTIVVEAVVIPNAAPVFEDPLSGDVAAPVATQKIYYHGPAATDPDGDIVTYSWDASGAGEFTDEDVDEGGIPHVFFAADAAGSYVVTLTADDGKGGVSRVSAMTGITDEFDVGDYPSDFDFVGYATCLACHPGKGDEGAGTGWFATNHAMALEHSGVLDPNNGHGYRNESCYNCHALGWEPNDSGQGFIDNELTPEFGNIQCESCHGGGNPAGFGAGHKGVVWNPLVGMLYDDVEMTWVPDNDFDSSMGVGCGACHEGSRHGAVEQWAESGHGNLELIEGDPGSEVVTHRITNSSCSPCHSGQQFAVIHRGDDPLDLSGLTLDDPLEDHLISCATCHTPHDAANEKQLRIGAGDGVGIPFSDVDGVPTMVEGGWGNICIECHNGRRDRGDYDSHIQNGSGHFGPHGNPQGAMFFGLMGADLGVGATVGSTEYEYEHPHLTWNENTCVSCHMYRQPYISSDEPASFGHTFEPDFRNCNNCHTNWNDDQEADFWLWVEDYQTTEIGGLLQAFLDAWPNKWKDGEGEPVSRDNDPPEDIGPARDDPVGNAYRAALWDYFLVLDDATHGVHNPTFSKDLLMKATASVEELNALP